MIRFFPTCHQVPISSAVNLKTKKLLIPYSLLLRPEVHQKCNGSNLGHPEVETHVLFMRINGIKTAPSTISAILNVILRILKILRVDRREIFWFSSKIISFELKNLEWSIQITNLFWMNLGSKNENYNFNSSFTQWLARN